MALIQVNEEVVEVSLNSDSSLQTIIPQVHGKAPYSKYKLLSVTLNGSKVEAQFDRSSLTRPLSSEDHIKLTLDGNLNLDMVKNIEELSKSIIDKISNLDFTSVEHYGNELSEVIAGVEVFISSTSFIVRKFSKSEQYMDDLPIKSLQIHLLSVLKGIETAHNSKDLIMLEDLLEFELKDNLTKWKILVTPTLKIQAQNPF